VIVSPQRFREIDPRWVAGFATAAAALWIGQTAAQSPLLVLALVPLAAFVFVAFRWPWLALFIYVGALVLAPAYVGVVLGPFGAWTPTRVIGLIYAVVLVARSGFRPSAWNTVDVTLCVFLLLSSISLPLKGTGVTATMKAGMYTVLDYGVPYLVMRLASSDLQQTKRLISLLTFWAVIVGLLAVAEVVLGTNPFLDLGPQLAGEDVWTTVIYRGGGQRAQVSFSHPISLGMFAALTLPVSLWITQHAGSRRRALATGAGALVIAAMLFATLSRGPWIGGFCAVAIGLLLRTGIPRTTRVLVALALCAPVAIYATGLTPLTGIVNASFDPSTAEFANIEYRQGLVPFVLDLWSRSPIIGYADLTATGTSIDNYYLALLLLSGLVGELAFGALLIALLQRLWRAARSSGGSRLASDLALVLIAALIGQLVILAGVAMVGSGPYFFWGLIGIAAGKWSNRRGAHTSLVSSVQSQNGVGHKIHEAGPHAVGASRPLSLERNRPEVVQPADHAQTPLASQPGINGS
jgi:hypothetical protein